jgi:membrane protease YdiL (CAAX protease family)
MAGDHAQDLSSLSQVWWMVAAALSLPVSIVVFRRIGRWWLSDRPIPAPAEGEPVVPWPAWFGLALFIAMQLLFFVLLGGYQAAAGAGLLPWEPLKIPVTFSPGVFLGQVLPPVVGLVLVAQFGRPALDAAGVRCGTLRKGLLDGLVAVAAILPVCFAGLIASTVFMELFKVPVAPHPLLETVQKAPEPWVIPVALVQAGVLAPLGEEFMYRGVLMMTLLKQMGILWTLILSSAIFAVAHVYAEPQAVVPLFLLGLALGYVAYRTRSLVAPIVTHSLFNVLMIVGPFLGGR